MEAMQHFERLCQAMADPALYPHPVSCLERRDTHISAVFLTGPWVYKLKKPVDFGFLDFRTLDARRHFCHQEVILNQRLSCGVYEGVVPIREDPQGRISLGGDGKTVEYAVKMKQLQDDDNLHMLLQKGLVHPEEMERLGRHLAEFYDRCDRNVTIDHFGHTEVIAINMEENFRQIEPYVDDVIQREPWEFIRQASRAFFENWADLFSGRVREGRIRDGHGDLRAEHIYFSDGIQIIDCIEFNDRFRYGDVVCDLAFLYMDMENLGHPEMSRIFLAAYAKEANDPGLYALLDFYAAYRAVVKLKVACLGLPSRGERSEKHAAALKQADAYLNLAYRYAIRFSRPTLWVFCGLPATGKSSLALQVSKALEIAVFQSDRIRKEEGVEHLPKAEVVPFAQGAYRPELRQRIYAKMLFRAQEELKKGHSVILDASYSHRKWREDVKQLAADLDTNVLFIECTCSEETMRERLKGRESRPGLSDARLQHLPEMVASFEPLEEAPPESLIQVRTEAPFFETFMSVLSKAYELKCLQVNNIL